jgi:hypothetical protein
VEAAVLGVVLGGTLPLRTPTLGWGPKENVVTPVPLGAIAGFVCAFFVVWLQRVQLRAAIVEKSAYR